MLDRIFKRETSQPSQPQQASMPLAVVEAADDIQSTLLFFAAMPRDNFQQRYLMQRVTMHPDDGKEPKTQKPEIILIFSCQTLKGERAEMEARFRHKFDKAAQVWESKDKMAISFSMLDDQIVYGLETQIGATAERSTTQLHQDILDAIASFLARTSPDTVKKVDKLHRAAITGRFL